MSLVSVMRRHGGRYAEYRPDLWLLNGGGGHLGPYTEHKTASTSLVFVIRCTLSRPYTDYKTPSMGFYPIVRKTGTLYRKIDGDHGPYAEYKITYMGVGLVPLMRATLGLILDRWSQWAFCQLTG